MLRTLLTVTRKELRDAVRDRRSLAMGLFYGVWGPLVMVLAVTAIARARSTDVMIDLPTSGRHEAPALAAYLGERGVTLFDAPEAARDRIRARELRLALVIADDFAADFVANRPATVTLLYDSAWAASKASADRVKAALSEYMQHVAGARLIVRGVSPSVVSPIDLENHDLSTAASRAAAVVGTLPIFVLLAAFVGGMGIAADATAGERERGSLEALLLYPAPRLALAAGKWLAAAVLATATVTVTVVLSAAMLQHPTIQTIDLPIGLSVADALLVWALMLPLTLLAPSIQLLIGLFSRTFKEANTTLSLLIFVPMLPGFLFAFGTVQPQAWMTSTPILGQQLLIASVLRGEPLSGTGAATLAVICVSGTALAVAVTASLLNREWLVRRGGA